MNTQKGFTLVELAIVLVVIGLILGMAFKGKDLIDSARVKSLAAQYEKINSAMYTYLERYGSLPGDGCTVNNTTDPRACATGTKDGLISNGQEASSFWSLLISTRILNQKDRESVFGQQWNVWRGTGAYLSNTNASYLDLPGHAQSDPRVVCALDRMMDDGNAATGRMIATIGTSNTPAYAATDDCWSMNHQGQVNFHLQILP